MKTILSSFLITAYYSSAAYFFEWIRQCHEIASIAATATRHSRLNHHDKMRIISVEIAPAMNKTEKDFYNYSIDDYQFGVDMRGMNG